MEGSSKTIILQELGLSAKDRIQNFVEPTNVALKG